MIPRTTTKLRARTGIALYRRSPSQVNKKVFHYGSGRTPKTEAEELQLLRIYDNYHASLGWGGIGYNLAVGPVTGKVYEARGLDYIGSHATGQNTSSVGIVMIGGNDALTAKAKQGLRRASQIADRWRGKNLPPYGHKDFASTSCPGSNLYNWLKAGGLGSGTASGAPTVSNYNPRGFNAAYIREVQTLLFARGYNIGAAGIDGIMGPSSAEAVKRFQKAVGITQDSIPGADTMKHLRRPFKIDADKHFGFKSTVLLQVLLSTPIDGSLSGQPAVWRPHHPRLHSAKYVARLTTGSTAVKALQKKLKVTPDGSMGPGSIQALQRKLGVDPDKYLGPDTAGRWQRKLNQGKVF